MVILLQLEVNFLLVYILNKNNEPLMPCSSRKARLLLKEDKATVVKRTPFTIRLKFGSSGYKQPVNLGVDIGSKVVGLSATTKNKELYAAELHLRNDIVNLLSTRRQYRRTRRNRLRYRKVRFLNRVKSKHKDWIAPSIENKIYSHIKMIENIHKILSISKIVVETAKFDIQKIKNPEIKSVEYRQGEQLEFYNVREYVLWRDGYKCKGRKGCKNKKIRAHHIISRKFGGDRPENFLSLCKECHDLYHEGKLKLDIKKKYGFRDAAHVNIMRLELIKRLEEKYSNIEETYGYITKFNRVERGLEKSHINDARCITNNLSTNKLNYYFHIKKVRCHNRQIHKAKILKGGKKKLNQAPYIVHGFRLFDKVKYNGVECFIFGRRQRGYFHLRKLSGEDIHKTASFKKLILLESIKNSFLIETIIEE
jgi:N6-L-threonylcarbamoyladenine synthase